MTFNENQDAEKITHNLKQEKNNLEANNVIQGEEGNSKIEHDDEIGIEEYVAPEYRNKLVGKGFFTPGEKLLIKNQFGFYLENLEEPFSKKIVQTTMELKKNIFAPLTHKDEGNKIFYRIYEYLRSTRRNKRRSQQLKNVKHLKCNSI